MKVCVIGLGHVGLPTARYIAEKGFDTWGLDLSPEAVDSAKRVGLTTTTDWSKVPNVDAYVICVSTLVKRRQPNVQPVFDVCKKIVKVAKPKALVSIESTIIPGTCRKIDEEIFNKRLRLVHIPHRYWEGDPVKHGVNQPRVIGGVNRESLNAGLAFYQDKLKIPLHIVPNVEVAEMCKVAENAYRYIEIAFAEELKLICNALNLDFEEVRKACNTKWNVQMLEARDGIKGHCIPKDTYYLASLSRHKELLESAMNTDKAYQKWLKARMRKAASFAQGDSS